MAVPRAAVFAGVELHGHAMRGALRCGVVCGLGRHGEPLQHRFETLQQPALVTVAQRELHLAAGELDVDVDTRWCLRQRHAGDRQRGLRWGWLARRGRLAVGSFPLRPYPCRNPLGDARGDAVLAPM